MGREDIEHLDAYERKELTEFQYTVLRGLLAAHDMGAEWSTVSGIRSCCAGTLPEAGVIEALERLVRAGFVESSGGMVDAGQKLYCAKAARRALFKSDFTGQGVLSS